MSKSYRGETEHACDVGVGLLYRQALLEAFPGVEHGMRSLGDRLRGRQRSSLYQVALTASTIMPYLSPRSSSVYRTPHRGEVAARGFLLKGYMTMWIAAQAMCGLS